MDGCNVLPETPIVGTRLRVDTTRVFSVWGSLPPWGAAGERSEFNIKPPLRAPLVIFPRGYLLRSFPQVDTSARQRGFEISVFPLLGELPKAIELQLPVIPLATRSQHVIFAYDQVVRPHRSYRPSVGFPGESHGPATSGFACNCQEPEAWTTEASGQSIYKYIYIIYNIAAFINICRFLNQFC